MESVALQLHPAYPVPDPETVKAQHLNILFRAMVYVLCFTSQSTSALSPISLTAIAVQDSTSRLDDLKAFP